MEKDTPLFSKKMKLLLSEGEILLAIEDLFEYLQKASPMLVNEVIMYKQQYLTVEREKRGGILTFEQYQLSINKVNNNLLYFLDQISYLEQEDTSTKQKNPDKGKLLHDIPNNMPLGVVTKCTVRIAEDESLLLEGFDLTPNSEIEDIPIKEIMEVELIDLGSDQNFEIHTLNSTEQALDPSNFTQWLFFVKPLNNGVHTLFLKVSAIHVINNKERKREIVLEKQVKVATNLEEVLSANDKRKWEDTQITLSPLEKESATIIPSNPKNYQIMGLNFSLTALLILAATFSTIAMSVGYVVWKNNTIKKEKQAILIAKDSLSLKNKSSEENIQAPNEIPTNIASEEKGGAPSLKNNKSEEGIKRLKEVSTSVEEVTEPEEKEKEKLPQDLISKAKRINYKLIDEITPKDAVPLGDNIVIKITTSGFKAGKIDFWISDKYNIKPRHKDGKTYFFELKSSTKTFDFVVIDTDSGNKIQQSITGNLNYDWSIKRSVGGIGVD